MAARPRLAWAALGFGLASLASSWNPAAAPLGLTVGLASAWLAARALAAGGPRWPAALGLVSAAAGLAVAATVLALTAGVGRQPAETSLVPQPTPAQAAGALDEAAARTGPARERARRELEALPPERQRLPSN